MKFKFLKFPTPKELGKAKYNALPSRHFTPWETEYCWEDHDAYLKKTYPIKFFLLRTAPTYLRRKVYYPIAVPVSDAWWWMKYHFIPKYRYHFLDLRQPNNEDRIDEYRYGWADVVNKMLYANFNLLKEYFDEEPHDLREYYSQEEIDAEAGLKAQQAHLNEAKAILHWWQVERKQDSKRINDLLTLWSNARKDDTVDDDPETERYWRALKEAEDNLESKTEEMLIRLIKLRRGLWT